MLGRLFHDLKDPVTLALTAAIALLTFWGVRYSLLATAAIGAPIFVAAVVFLTSAEKRGRRG